MKVYNIAEANKRIAELESQLSKDKEESIPEGYEICKNVHSKSYGKPVKKQEVTYATPVSQPKPLTAKEKRAMAREETLKYIREYNQRRYQRDLLDSQLNGTPAPSINDYDMDSTSEVPLNGEQLWSLQPEPAVKHVSTAPTYFIVKQGYYLTYENNVAYVGKPDSEPKRLAKSGEGYAKAVSTNAQIHGKANKQPMDLTQEEFKGLLTNKPSFQELTIPYELWENKDLVQMDYKNAVNVW